jgi:hypothetical protein
VFLTDEESALGRIDTIPRDTPSGVDAMVLLDWERRPSVGLEVLDASKVLHDDLLAAAES